MKNENIYEKIFNLSKLDFNEVEKEQLKNDLEKILIFISKIDDFNLENFEKKNNINKNNYD